MAEEVQIRNSTEQAKVRSPVAVTVFSLLTLGIYTIFWWYFINREMADFGRANGTEELGTSPGKSVLAITLGAIVIVPAIISYVNGFKRVQAAARLAGREEEPSGWIALIIVLVIGILFPAYVQSDLNKTWQRQARGNDALAGGNGPGTAIGEAPGETLAGDSATGTGTDRPAGTV